MNTSRRSVFALVLISLLITAIPLAKAAEAPLSDEARAVFDAAFDASRSKDIPKALSLYERALGLAPNHSGIWMEYAVALRHAGKLQRSAQASWRAWELPGAVPTILVNQANTLMSGAAYAAAMEVLEEAIAQGVGKALAVQTFTNIGFYAWGAGEIDMANRAFKRALEIDPDFAFARIDWHALQVEQGVAGALEAFQSYWDKARPTLSPRNAQWGAALLNLANNGQPHRPKPVFQQRLPIRFGKKPAAALELKIDDHSDHLLRLDAHTLSVRAPEALLRMPAKSAEGSMTLQLRASDASDMTLLISLLPFGIDKDSDFDSFLHKAGQHADPQAILGDKTALKGGSLKGLYQEIIEEKLLSKERSERDFPYATLAFLSDGKLTVHMTALSWEPHAKNREVVLSLLKSMGIRH